MRKSKYNIDELILKFKKNSEEYEKSYKGFGSQKDNELYFNVSDALLCICEEVKELKKETWVDVNIREAKEKREKGESPWN